MAVIRRRTRILPVSRNFTLATADDLDGVQDLTQSIDVTGASRIIVTQSIATDGAAGIDVACISHDKGLTWTPVTDGLAIDSDDSSGTVLVGGALNAAGVEAVVPTNVFKFGPYSGPTAFRILRKTGDFGAGAVTWTTGAPRVMGFLVGGNHQGGVPSTTLV
jgi:hypothetical protein